MGIDYGEKRVGVALSDEAGNFALPHKVIATSPDLIRELNEICIAQNVKTIVVGESRDYRGEENPIMKRIRRFADELGKVTGLPVVFERETLTSAEAERIQGATATLDASAAALILRTYLDTHHDHR